MSEYFRANMRSRIALSRGLLFRGGRCTSRGRWLANSGHRIAPVLAAVLAIFSPVFAILAAIFTPLFAVFAPLFAAFHPRGLGLGARYCNCAQRGSQKRKRRPARNQSVLDSVSHAQSPWICPCPYSGK